MTHRKRMTILAALVLFSLVPMSAFAGQTCPTATVVPADGRIVDFDFVAAGQTNFYQFSVAGGRSYSVEVRQDYDDPNNYFIGTQVNNEVTSCNVAVPNQVDTSVSEPTLPANSIRKSFTTAAGPAAIYSISVPNSGAAGRYVSVSISDTTLFCPNWSTFSNYLTQWTFLNTTNQAIHGSLTAIDTEGQVIHAPSTLSNFTIPAGSKVSKLIAGFGGAGVDINEGPQHGGFAVFTHDGPPGAVLASAYSSNPTVNPNNIVPGKFDAVRAGK